MNNRILKPENQKSLYASFGKVYEKVMNGELKAEDGEVAVKALIGMNTTFHNELKRAKIANEPIRVVESKNFEE